MEEEERETVTGIPELAGVIEPPASPASSVPENMRGIRMAPSDRNLQESQDGFFGRHETFHQTIPKVLWGAPRKEKGDTPKACSDPDSSGKRGPEPDSSLTSIPSIPSTKKSKGSPPSGENMAKTVDPPPLPKVRPLIWDCGDNVASMDEKASKEHQLDESEGKKMSCERSESKINLEQAEHLDILAAEKFQHVGSPCNSLEFNNLAQKNRLNKLLATDGMQEEMRRAPLDNKLVEKLASLCLQEEDAQTVLNVAQQSGNTGEVLKRFVNTCSSLEKMGSMADRMAQSSKLMESMLLDSLAHLETREEETVKEEKEDPLTRESMKLKSQPFDKRVAMKIAHDLYQHNRLNNQRLIHIYCYYLKQAHEGLQDSLGGPDNKVSSLPGFSQSLSSIGELDYPSDLKEGLSSIMSQGKGKEEPSGPESSQEHHLSEILMSDESSVRPEPMEQSFSFSTMGSHQTLPFTGPTESLCFAHVTRCLEAALLSVMQTILLGSSTNRQEGKILEYEDLRAPHKEVEKGEAEIAEKEKVVVKENMAEPDKEQELDAIKEVQESSLNDATELGVLEKSEFEESEKGEKAEKAGVSSQPEEVLPPNSSDDFKEDLEIPAPSQASLQKKQDSKGCKQKSKLQKKNAKTRQHLAGKKREKRSKMKTKRSNKIKPRFSCSSTKVQTPEPISYAQDPTDLQAIKNITDDSNKAKETDLQNTDTVPTEDFFTEQAENISEESLSPENILSTEHKEAEDHSLTEKDTVEIEYKDVPQSLTPDAENETAVEEDTAFRTDYSMVTEQKQISEVETSLELNQELVGLFAEDVTACTDSSMVDTEQKQAAEPEADQDHKQESAEDLTKTLHVPLSSQKAKLTSTLEDSSDVKAAPWLLKAITASLSAERRQTPRPTSRLRKHCMFELQQAFAEEETIFKASIGFLTKHPGYGKLVSIVRAKQWMPVTRDERSFLLRKPSRVDVRGVVAMVITASDTAGSGGRGQGSNSSNSNNRGGSGSGHSWGGARPKTTRNGSSSGSGQGGDDEDDNRRPPKRNLPPDLPLGSDVASVENPRAQGVAPPRDFKRHRKKEHGAISNEQLCHCLGQAGSGIEILRQSSGAGELNQCLLLCLHETSRVTSPSTEDLMCCTCAILHSLLSHFTNCAHGSGECTMCQQLFTLVQFHVQECLAARRGGEEEGEDLSLNVCHKMRMADLFTDVGVTAASARVWMKVRKYLSAALGPVILLDITTEGEELGQPQLDEHSNPPPRFTDPAATDTHHHSLPSPRTKSIPEYTPADLAAQNAAGVSTTSTTSLPQSSADFSQAVMPKSSQGTSLRRRPSTKVIPQRTIPEEPPSPRASSEAPSTPVKEEDEDVFQMKVETVVTLPSEFPRRPPETPDEQEDIMEYIRSYAERRSKEEVVRKYSDDPYSTQRVYGGAGTMSMPETQNRLIRVEQNLSVEMKPIGVPGIGEVVYGTRQQLLLVARNWRQERDECKASGKCRYQHREEGVILHAFKKNLKILHTRYQKHQQWERLVHLGNGVTGKCHLCIDRTSDFKFCCKKMHILQYEDQELEIWSELSHPNIVRFYGAIRHGEKIYLFAEFIDGGSLAALIKEQWTVGKRLSHWMALNYFRQLLGVLTYLQSMGVLHEDIKADNLLVRQGTTEIILADFGAAQQIPQDHTPPNRYPTGSPAHWSPEKAASEGHGFPSDLWACACVLIHMLGGSPPWIVRYPDAAILNFIIWSKPAPIEDVPDNVQDNMRDLISCCLVKDKAIRPTAQQILSHPAFQLLDQSGSFFSTFAQPAVAVQSCAGPVVPATTASPPQQEAQQASWEEGATSGRSVETSLTTSAEMHGPPLSMSITTSLHSAEMRSPLSMNITTSLHSGVRVVEVPREALKNPSGWTSPEHQSLPASFHTAGANSGGTEGRGAAVENSRLQRPTRRSAPEIVTPASAQESSQCPQGGIQHGSQRREGVIVVASTASIIESSALGRTEATRSNVQTNTSVFTFSTGRQPVEQEDVLVQQKVSLQKSTAAGSSPGLLAYQQERGQDQTHTTAAAASAPILGQGARPKGGLPIRSRSADDLMPEPLPEMPSPVLTLASEITTKMQRLAMSVNPGSGDSHYAMSQMSSVNTRHSGPTSLPVGKLDAVPRVRTQQKVPTVSVSTLQVPAPLSFSSAGGRSSEMSPSNSLGDRENASSLLPHGGRSLSSLESCDTQHPPARRATPGGQMFAVMPTPEEAQPATVQSSGTRESGGATAGQSASGSIGSGEEPMFTSTTGLTPTLVRIPLELGKAPEKPQYVPPQDQARSKQRSDHQTVAPEPPNAQTPGMMTPFTSAALRPSSLTPSQSTTAGVGPGMRSINPFQATVPTTVTEAAVPVQQADSRQAGYPVLPPLNAVDIQLPSPQRGGRHWPMLSMIREEQDSLLPPSTHISGSMESSDDDMISNYIQDQFLSMEGRDPVLQSLTEQSGNRPRLEVYQSPAGGEAAPDDQQQLMPKFHLLSLQSLSDSSTLRSGRNTFSSGEMDPAQQPQTTGPAGSGSTERVSVQAAAGVSNAYSSHAAQQGVDEPDQVQKQAGTRGPATPDKARVTQPGKTSSPLVRGNSDEDHISSGDLFGSGPSNNQGFQEAYAYREKQQEEPQDLPHHQQQQYLSPSSPALTQPAVCFTATSPRLARKNPNLRLNVSPVPHATSNPTRPPSRSEALRTSQSSATLDSAHSQQTQGSDDAFLLNTGTSPLTASPLVAGVRQGDGRPRSRNESGSSTSTPRSSTYDRQEQEWTNLQLQTPGFYALLAEDPMIASTSELSDVSSNHHLSLLYDQQGESTSDQEANSILSMLQEEIKDENLRGKPLTFTNPNGQTLFNMRITGRNKSWKELGNTFRAQLHKAGFRHFTLMHADGLTPVDYFSTFNATIGSVKVFELGEERDLSRECWCADHLVY